MGIRHRVWMIRSYALTCAAITLRIITPVGIVLGATFETSYLIAAWGCWIVNVIIAEWIVRTVQFRETGRLRPARRAAAPVRATGGI